MNDLSGEVRRLCVAVGAERHSGRTAEEQKEVRRRLGEVIAEAGREAGLDRLYLAERGTPAGARTTTFTPGQGDGSLLVLPSGVSEARVVAGFIGELRVALWRQNRRPGADAATRLRLRVAFHQGPTRIGDGGFVGRAVTTVCGLRDSDELRAALEERPDSDLAVIVSAQLFEDVIEHECRDLRKRLFRRVTVRSMDAAEAWISVPDVPEIPYQARTSPAARERSITPVRVVNIDEY